MKNQNSINFILYQSIFIIFINFIISNNVFLKLHPNSAFIIPIVSGIISLLFIFFLPSNSNKLIHNNKLLKNIINIYYIVMNVLLITISSYILVFYFFGNTSFYMMSLLLILIILFFSLFDKKYLYDISVTIFIISLLVNMLFIFNTSMGKVDLLYNIDLEKIFPNNYLIYFPLLFVLFDPIISYHTNIGETKKIKKDIIISTIIGSIISTIIIGINYFYLSKEFIPTTLFPQFLTISLFLGPEFIDHFMLFILLDLLVLCFSKCSLNLSIISNSMKKGPFVNIFISMFVLLLCIGCFKYLNSYINVFCCLGSVLSIIIFIIYIFILFNKKVKKDAS